ncbi:MAG: VOC family protein [Hamadaea sp.]|uniref:VOC family protein n=1 Tax=Hamadaea sp. TaxID=2024425 RepID=UPI00182C833F|nr:VOC family protein [Hamadaea sp.]NUT24318.1 VOC family protein [Hamadaea sp.]
MIRWTYAFLDRPSAAFDQAASFWAQATGTTLSPRRGEFDEFATFLPEHGDPVLKLQAVGSLKPAAVGSLQPAAVGDTGGAHLDFAVDDVPAFVTGALAAGAFPVADHGDLVVLRSPAGHLFCAVPWRAVDAVPRIPPAATGPSGVRVRADQMCVDALPDGFATEYAFWGAITGFTLEDASLPEFHRVVPPPGLPIRLLVQRLGSPTDVPAMHLDLACSDVRDAVAWHVSLGAAVVDVRPGWTVMRDPAGGVYCLTSRLP